MSTPHGDGHLDVSDFLDENGNIDARRLADLPADRDRMPPADCAAIRRDIIDPDLTPSDVAEKHDWSLPATRDHASGRCEHDHDVPPRVFVRKHARGWMRKGADDA